MKWRLVPFLLLFSFLACSPRPVWVPYEGVKKHVYPGEHWRKATAPEQLGWSSEKLTRAREYSRKIGSDAVMIVDNGVVVDAWGDITKNYQCHSMRKSLLSGLYGVHVDEGGIDLSKTIGELGIDDHDPSLTPQEKQATVGDLMKARSGIYHPALGESQMMKAIRPKRDSHKPGTFWYYNNWDFNALGTIFEKETGKKIFEEFDARFAKPLQMEDFDVGSCRYLSHRDYKQAPLSMHRYYLFRMSARDLARFGLLFLREGRWRSEQIISSAWVRESTASYSRRGVDGGYGYMWWTGVRRGFLANVSVQGHSYYAAGWGGHRVFVLPYRGLVVVHRVNTDSPGRQVSDHHIGRLLWLILSAAGEREIGDEPAIEASRGVRLKNEDLKGLFEANRKWVAPNTILPNGGESLVLSCLANGELSLSLAEGLEFKGKWWISRDRLYFRILGSKSYFLVVKEAGSIKFFDATGTLFGKFTAFNP